MVSNVFVLSQNSVQSLLLAIVKCLFTFTDMHIYMDVNELKQIKDLCDIKLYYYLLLLSYLRLRSTQATVAPKGSYLDASHT